MNREIKFRAWDGEKIQKDFIIGRPQAADCLSIMTDEKFALKQYSLKEWKVMQYTGLKDKHGKEIYEGDIMAIKTTYHSYPISVIFSEGAFSFKEDGSYGTLAEWNEHSEIIGNIWENPELLSALTETKE